MHDDLDDGDAHVAVVAHGLVGTATAIRIAATTLREHPDLDPAKRDEVLGMLEDLAGSLAAGLLDLVRTGGRRVGG